MKVSGVLCSKPHILYEYSKTFWTENNFYWSYILEIFYFDETPAIHTSYFTAGFFTCLVSKYSPK